IGLLHVADDLHQQHPGHEDDRENDDKSDHATPLLEAIAPFPRCRKQSGGFQDALADGPCGMPGKNGVLSLLAQQIC
ncbi:hypothetical protein, partial [Mesorhizobium sp. M7A.F.Ca.CA.001.08.2.1]|uniref:hypothetical protein n=1 Tax=Mesorhizobium sp. M7A.F.Ca.CA.001.08.2.1 TaxID=2496692 RepID=UPI0019D254CE